MKTSFLSKIFFGAAIIGASFLTSCGDDKQSETQTATENSAANSTTTNSEGKETAQLNPEHGLPGHRCDLPVGAPLPSSNTTQATPAETSAVPTNVSPIRVDKSPEVNPPHGEPGHDCAIPVGAPLK